MAEPVQKTAARRLPGSNIPSNQEQGLAEDPGLKRNTAEASKQQGLLTQAQRTQLLPAQVRKELALALQEEYRVPGAELEGIINSTILSGVKAIMATNPQRERIMLNKELAADFRARGLTDQASYYEGLAAGLEQQYQRVEKDMVRPYRAFAQGLLGAINPIAGDLFGPEAAKLYTGDSEGAPPSAPTQRRRFATPSKD